MTREEIIDFCEMKSQLEPENEDIFSFIIKALNQEPQKPMVEIDLYSVIKQKYIERDVLDKIRAEIEEIQTYDGIYIDRAYVLQIIDKYKKEGEQE